ncbi:MAG: hypothetical protein ACJ749_19720 [Flavisolibacter sp.]
MESSILFHIPAWLVALVLLPLSILLCQFGFRYRKLTIQDLRGEDAEVTGNSMLGLTALLLAFTFNMSTSKFENRQNILIEEVNNIGTAILRCDLYPDSVKKQLIKDFKKYVNTRINYYLAADNEEQIHLALKESELYVSDIWKVVTNYSHYPAGTMPSMLMVPALNDMIDIVTTRDAGRIAKVPPAIILILLLLLLMSSFYLGYKQKSKWSNSVVIILWSATVALTLYIMLEMDRPRRGLINLDNMEKKMEQLQVQLNTIAGEERE